MASRPAASIGHPGRLLGLAIGVGSTLVGLRGFVVTGFADFAEKTDEALFGLKLNPLYKPRAAGDWPCRLGHVAPFGHRPDPRLAAAGGLGLMLIFGLSAGGNPDLNLLSLNAADNVLHLVSALAGAAIALWPASRAVREEGRAAPGVPDRGPAPLNLGATEQTSR